MLQWRILLACLLASPAWANPPAGTPLPAVMPAPSRFPQPVRAGSLAGRQVLRPREAQDVLGRAEGVLRGTDGTLLVLVNVGSTLNPFRRRVLVPLAAVALLGEHLALMDLPPRALQTLPPYQPGIQQPVPGDEIIQVGLTRPLH